MLTRNFYGLLEHSLNCATSIANVGTNVVSSKGESVTYFSNDTTSTSRIFPGFVTSIGTAPGVNCFWLGSGSSASSLSDYTLEEPIESNRFTQSAYREGNKIIFTITNISPDPLTIGEIGWFTDKAYQRYSNKNYPVMTDRTVLDSPITLQQGEVGKIEYAFSVLKPTDAN